jgi:uncharacterized protein (TIGR00369 family)
VSTNLERLQMMVRGDTPPPPIARLLGFRLASAAPGRVRIEFDAGPQHANPMGTLHGGVFCDIADAAMGMAYASTLADSETFTTVELKINFLAPVWSGRLLADGRVIKRGRSLGLVECDVTDASGRLVARASSTCMTLRDERARGRAGATRLDAVG